MVTQEGQDWNWDWSPAGVAAVFTVVLYLFLYGRAARKPTIVGNGPLKEKLLQACPIFRDRYWPTFWAFHGQLTTLIRFFLQKGPDVHYRREILTLADGGEVALDWGTMKDPSQPEGVRPSPSQQDLPLLLILPGITGSSEESYCTHLVQDGIVAGYRPVVFNQRGFGGVPLKTLRIFCVSKIEDLFEIVQYIQSKYRNSQIVAMGISLGGMNLVQYQHRLGKNSELAAVITCGALWDPHRSRYNLEGKLVNRVVYSRVLSSALADMIISNFDHLSQQELMKLPSLDVNKLSKARVVSEVHTQVTVPLFGYTCLDEYYKDSCNNGKVHKIEAPLVCLTAADDPFVPKDSLPIDEFEANPHTVMVLTSHGGHFGFIEGIYPTDKTWMDRTVRQVLEAFKSIL